MALATKQKPKAHTRKRQAQHHRQSKHYIKAYWPYLPMLAVIAVGFVVNTAWSKTSVLGAERDYSAASLLDATNAERAKQSEGALRLDSKLSAAAQAKANDMAKYNYWAHTSPAGTTPWSVIGQTGYQYQSTGENLAYGFSGADTTVTGWMNSKEHRTNVLNTNYKDVGFGVAQATNYQGHGPQTIVVAEYAQPVDGAVGATFTTPANVTTSVASAPSETAAQPVSRIQLLTGGNASWSVAVVSAIAGGALVFFVTKHGLRLHKALVRGEHFVAHHPWLDVAVVAVFMLGFILTRSSGIIR